MSESSATTPSFLDLMDYSQAFFSVAQGISMVSFAFFCLTLLLVIYAP